MDNSKGKLKTMLEVVIENLVDIPEEVSVTSTSSDGNTVLFTVHVAKGEVGKVIGKRGKIAQALRFVLESASAKYKNRAILEIADD